MLAQPEARVFNGQSNSTVFPFEIGLNRLRFGKLSVRFRI